VGVVVTAGFETFFRAEFPKMVALGLSLTGDRETARDLAQESLLRAYVNWDRIEGLDRPGGWVRRVLINLATDHHRRRRTVGSRAGQRQASGQLLPDDPVSEDWWAAVRALPDRQRAAIALHYLDDRPIAEVAEILGIAPGTVKSSLAKARDTLKKQMKGSQQ